MQIDQVPGLEQELVLRLRAAGIRDCRQLLRASRRRGRLALLSESMDLPIETLNVLVAKAGLCQIRGIGPTMLDKLWRLGVCSMEELAAWDPDELREQLRQATDRPPNLAVIEDWIRQAQGRTGKKPAAFSLGLPT